MMDGPDDQIPDPDSASAGDDTTAFDADPELGAELQRLGLQGDIAALKMKKEATEVVSFVSPVTLLPVPFIMATLTQGAFGEETLGLGLRQTVRALRPHGETLLLGESLLSLARASRTVESLETRLEWILEAIRTFRALKAGRRLGRAYVDLATNLKDGKDYYDALHALDEGETSCARDADMGGVAAARYHRAHIYRMIGQPIEALHGLQQALEVLPDGHSAESWRYQIRSERVFNQLILERFDDALRDLEAWVASGDDHYFPFFYRGEVFERRGDPQRALADYAEASIRLARDILRSRSDRFRRVQSLNHRHMFERAVQLSLHLDDSAMALTLLELMNTGGRALHGPETTDAAPDQDVLARITAEAGVLRDNVLDALSREANGSLAAFQERADLLLAERDLLGESARAADEAGRDHETDPLAGIRHRLIGLLPHDAVLLEYTIAGDELWLLAATRETTLLHRCAQGRFELEMLKRSVVHECEGLLEPIGLTVLEQDLLAPAADLLSKKKRVVITLADAAYGIPFHAMRWTGGVLIETHDVQYIVGGVTVASAKRAASRAPAEGPRWRFLGTASVSYVAVDHLPGVETESALVKELVPAAERRIDLPATSGDVFDGEPAAVLHVACHGVHEERAPLLSRLLFADRPVFAFEIALGQLTSGVAIIAGCQTASAMSASGGYVQSLASAFHRAGVRTVVASLWPIDDEASAELMRTVYEGLRRAEPLSPVAALCAAQRALRARAEFAHLWYWAPFLVFEDLEG